MHLIYFFTAGPDEVRAWTVKKDTPAPRAAGVIHTDFEKNFICGESEPPCLPSLCSPPPPPPHALPLDRLPFADPCFAFACAPASHVV